MAAQPLIREEDLSAACMDRQARTDMPHRGLGERQWPLQGLHALPNKSFRICNIPDGTGCKNEPARSFPVGFAAGRFGALHRELWRAPLREIGNRCCLGARRSLSTVTALSAQGHSRRCGQVPLGFSMDCLAL